jgi:hypothetical protein
MNSELSDLLYTPKTETDAIEAKRLADNEVINHQRTLDT